MGDRAVIVLETNSKKPDCAIYIHSAGYRVKYYLSELNELMGGRISDLPYSTARLIGIIHDDNPGKLGLGTLDLESIYGHGDRGTIIWNVEADTVRVVNRSNTYAFGSFSEFISMCEL